ncbi:acetylornithine transaminase [Arthrobacter sp. UM1]|uniref:acetylornithine transaminase n=1 Tax=Arthrobacter sp. UM1 TaxID=2766776 RepID=UPI001CF671E5|nr:acetylornithine transaminase [Arthrobacter sp. UM1]MCB4208135.1 acetylornithine transaminase [Arthrobacter sp. UM1]
MTQHQTETQHQSETPDQADPQQSAEAQGQTPSSELLGRYGRSYTGMFGPPKLALVKGRGCRVWDADGRAYLDLLGGIAVNAIGHAHPRWAAAVADQAATLSHVSNFFATPPQIALAERLIRLAGLPEGSAAFLVNSGAEANEAAFKLARLHAAAANARDGGARTEVVVFEGAFHGRTMGALALTSKEAYRAPFEPLPGGVRRIPYGDAEAARAAIGPATAAVVVEPVQGEAGVVPPPEGWLRLLRELTRDAGALLIADEVQTGIGRTGRWLASEGVEPDAVTLAKGLGGGFPVGALLTRGPEVSRLFSPGGHGTTFGGNALAARAALETLAVIEEEGLLEAAEARGAQLEAGLDALPEIGAVRRAGLLLGADLSEAALAEGLTAPDVVRSAQERGFLLNATSGSTLRLAPPLVLAEAEAAEFIHAMPEILSGARKGQPDHD